MAQPGLWLEQSSVIARHYEPSGTRSGSATAQGPTDRVPPRRHEAGVAPEAGVEAGFSSQSSNWAVSCSLCSAQ